MVLGMQGESRFLELARLVDKYSGTDGIHSTAVPGLTCLKISAAGGKVNSVYVPSVCIVVQGRKRVLLEDEIFKYAPGQYLAVSVDLPLLGQVTEASRTRPYLCLQIHLDAAMMSELIAQSVNGEAGNDRWSSRETERGLFVGDVDDAMLDAVLRLARLLESPRDIPILAPMTMREVHYRMLSAAHGPAIAQIAVAGSNTQKIAQAIRRMKSNFTRTTSIEDLAAAVSMSPSSFHQHFKAVTAMSPLQFQKRMRLMEARQIMLTEPIDAASTAYRVGYESPSQFSREYARMFGAPPIRDIAGIRDSMIAP
jgi:AraC-like DNA-binding protein